MRTEGVTCVWSLAAWPCAMADSDKAMPLRACRMRSPPHVDVARTRATWVTAPCVRRVHGALFLLSLRFCISTYIHSCNLSYFIHGTPQRHIVTKVAATKAKVLSEAGSRGRSTELTYRDTTQKQASLRVRAGASPTTESPTEYHKQRYICKAALRPRRQSTSETLRR